MPLAKSFRRALTGAILALVALPALALEGLTYADDLAATAVEAGLLKLRAPANGRR